MQTTYIKYLILIILFISTNIYAAPINTLSDKEKSQTEIALKKESKKAKKKRKSEKNRFWSFVWKKIGWIGLGILTIGTLLFSIGTGGFIGFLSISLMVIGGIGYSIGLFRYIGKLFGYNSKNEEKKWASLKKGMTKNQVTSILGKPKSKKYWGGQETYNYSSGGTVTFNSSGRLWSWFSPTF